MGAAPLVDFTKLKSRVSIMDIAQHYDLSLEDHNGQHIGDCPVCGEGDPESTKFKITVDIGGGNSGWKCFSCDEGGNMLDLVATMEKASVKDAARLVADWFDVTDCFIEKNSRSKKKTTKTRAAKAPPESSVPEGCEQMYGVEDEVVEIETPKTNPPLDWPGLKNLDHEHESIVAAGVDPKIVQDLNGGMCSNGIMADRLALPVYDSEFRLLGYCGVALDQVSGEERLKWPDPVKFNPHLELINYPRFLDKRDNDDTVFICIDPIDTLKQLKICPNVLGVFQPSMTTEQIEKLQRVLTLDRRWRIVLRLRSVNDIDSFTLAALAQVESVSIEYIP